MCKTQSKLRSIGLIDLRNYRSIFNRHWLELYQYLPEHPPCWGEPFPLVPELRGDEKTLSFRLTFWLQRRRQRDMLTGSKVLGNSGKGSFWKDLFCTSWGNTRLEHFKYRDRTRAGSENGFQWSSSEVKVHRYHFSGPGTREQIWLPGSRGPGSMDQVQGMESVNWAQRTMFSGQVTEDCLEWTGFRSLGSAVEVERPGFRGAG